MSNKMIVALAMLAISASTAHADDANQTMFRVSGFGTIGATHSSENRGDYVLDVTMPKGAGLSNNWAMGNDTRFGVNLSADFTPQLTAVLQVKSEYQSGSNYRPSVDWANVKYAFTPDFYVRVGRISLPTFMNSDTRGVGYSYPWVHPPVDLYHLLVITNSDGVDAMLRFDAGEATNVIKAIYGKNTVDRPTATIMSKGLWGVFDTFECGAFTLRGGYQEREVSALNLYTGITGSRVRNSDLSLGAAYDPGNWFVMGEWIQRKSTSKRAAMYASTGYRIDKFTPYLGYSQDSPASFLPNVSNPNAASIQSAKSAQSTASVGVRWDFMRNADLKLQYDVIKLGADSSGDLANVPVTINPYDLYGAKFHVFSIVADFVF